MNTRFSALAVFLSVIYSTCIWAVPAAPLQLELSQPDGTIFTAIPRGDEYANWMETTAGHSIVKYNGTWFYAERDNAGTLTATGDMVGSLSAIELQSMPTHLAPTPDPQAFEESTIRKIPRGTSINNQNFSQAQAVSHTQYVLTVLADYTDQDFTYSDDSFQSLIYGASDSVREFFLENSYGGFTVAAATESEGVANDGIIHVSRAVTHPDPGGDSSASRTEAREIVNLVDSYIDFSAYDTDFDGRVSEDELSIVIILAGYETSYGGESSALTPNVWGHRWSFPSDLTLDGVDLRPYTMFGEAHATNNGNKHQATIGIMCHELGHLMLGLPDLYDTDGGSNGIGDWGLMGGGSWNVESGWLGTSPSHLSAWSKVATGLTVPEDIDSDQSGVSIVKADSNEVAKRVWIDKYKSAASYEYFLVENRQLSGYDAGLPAAGLMIWHIDESRTNNRDENHKWVDVEAADGLTHLDLESNDGDTGDPFPGVTNNTTFDNTSTPNSSRYSGAGTGIGVTSISASSATMTADFTAIAGGVGDHVRYDESGFNAAAGFSSTTAWLGVRFLNDTLFDNLDGVDVYINDGSGATVDIFYYSSMDGGTPSGLIYSQTGVAAGFGWSRLLFTTPQVFPIGAERGVVLKIVNDSGFGPIVFDRNGTDAGRSYFSSDGMGTFTPMCSYICGDINLTVLLSGDGDTAPAASSITPATTGPTNSGSVSFDITFSEDVVNFNNSADVIITHSGTSNGGMSITGSGSSYTANVTGISGTGSFTLEVDTGSDVEGTTGIALGASVTSASVNIDNTSPTAITVTPSTTGPTSAGSVGFDITFSENVVNFNDASDVMVTHSGTSHSGVSIGGSGSSYSVNVIGIAGDGSFTLNVNTGSDVQDAATNVLGSSVNSAAVSIDNTAPAAVSITPAGTGPTNADTMSFDITFDEDVVNFNDMADVIVNHTGTSHSGVNITGSGASYSADVTGIAGDGSFTLAVNTGSDVEDTVTNALGSSVTSAAVSIDNTSPSASIGAASAESTTVGPVSYTITYAEANDVSLAGGDITLNKTGSADGSIAISGEGPSVRMVTVSNISGDGTLGISIGPGTATDSAGNEAAAAGPSGTFAVDNTGPTVTTITPLRRGPTNAGNVRFDVTFSEDVVNFNDSADVTINHTDTSHGSVSISGSGASYTVNVMGITGDGSFTLEVNTGSDVEDALSNILSSSVSSEPVTIDNTAPAISIGIASLDTTMRGPVSYTVTFEEAESISLAADDLSLNKTGTADGSVAVSGTGTSTRTVTISNITGDGSLGFSIGPGTATDSAGNEADTAGPSGTFSVVFVEKIMKDSFE